MPQDIRHLLCVDASYMLFYRANALRAWHKHRTKEEPDESTLMSKTYEEKMVKRVKETLIKLYKTYQPDVVLCAYDGHKNWRKALSSTYKASRKYNNGILHLFSHGLNEMRKLEFIQECPVIHLHHEQLEADDIIHYHGQHILSTLPSTQMTIIANDHDYLPLLCERINLMNLQGKHLERPCGLDGPQYLMFKIIMGDKSDNIPKVFDRCGKKTACKLAQDPDLLRLQLEKAGHASQTRFKQNMQLIDNRKVPSKLQKWMADHFVGNILYHTM